MVLTTTLLQALGRLMTGRSRYAATAERLAILATVARLISVAPV